ncbi:MAG TPA: hypothetical protein VL688_06785 [Verrucomicrobiae bacterium]|nr:hypothetical protein [Verrucomicrobiae bacterium]
MPGAVRIEKGAAVKIAEKRCGPDRAIVIDKKTGEIFMMGMRRMKVRSFAAVLLIAMQAAPLAGCGEKEFKTFAEIDREKEAARNYSKGKLERLARNASEKRYENMKKFREVEAKVRDIPLEKQFDKPASKLKDQMRFYTDKVAGYNMLYDSYMYFYLQKGGDYEKIKLRRDED